MRNKELITKKIEQLANLVTTLEGNISRGATVEQFRESLEKVRIRLEEMQTLINTESDSWN